MAPGGRIIICGAASQYGTPRARSGSASRTSCRGSRRCRRSSGSTPSATGEPAALPTSVGPRASRRGRPPDSRGTADSAASERRRRPEPAGRGTLRDEQRRLTRRRLADAAVELFEEAGYAAATAEGIAKRAGANRATFYLHYGSKADVVLELMEAMHDDVVAVISRVGALEDPELADVRAWLAEVVAFFEANRALVDAHHQAMPVEPRVAQRWWKGYEQMADALSSLGPTNASACLSSPRS